MWLQNQIALPPTKHRAYLRQHSESIAYNNTVGETSARVQHPCSPFSRWRHYAFASSFRFQPFDVVPYGNQFVIVRYGSPLTIVDNFSGVPEDGVVAFSGAGQYEFCEYF